ncbi:DUF1129 domain-containing protein [Lactobacillus helveticus]|uniref:DUF1129 domain-containing protein n=1 Tax=Lactobacillus helveticus TaxID=1587 RepID=UPI001C64AB4C|nr:DUF1129 domain-containing protein [Lactobacillus helveticus]MBW8013672.1 DUF1129 domain-containing protein [Lactobacillus helveticus]
MAEETKKEQTASNSDSEKQAKLKRQTEADNQDEEIKQMNPKELRNKLSNKNQDYVFRLEKELQLQGSISRAEAVEMTDKLLGEIIVAQRHGQPANGLYLASPKIKAEQMLHPDKKPVATPFWQLAIDGALMYLAIFVGLFGIVALFETKKQPANSQMGILTLASVGIVMGIGMVKYNDWIMPKNGKRQSWAKIILGMIAVVVVLFVWIWLLSLPALKPINPVLPGEVDIIIAAIAFGARYLFRRYYKITGSPFAPNVRRK